MQSMSFEALFFRHFVYLYCKQYLTKTKIDMNTFFSFVIFRRNAEHPGTKSPRHGYYCSAAEVQSVVQFARKLVFMNSVVCGFALEVL